LCALPSNNVPSKPEPISKPLAAGSDMQALASSASSLSKTGEPRPEGTLYATHSTTPPMELPVRRILSTRSTILSEVSLCGQRTWNRSISSAVPRLA